MSTKAAIGEEITEYTFLERGIRRELMGAFRHYVALDNNIFELSELWALYYYLQTDISEVEDFTPHITNDPQESTANIFYVTGNTAVNLKFRNIRQPE